MRRQTCCFTGHRQMPPDITAVMARAKAHVLWLLSKGVTYFCLGGAVGFDTLAAEMLFSLREADCPEISVTLLKPYDGFQADWPEQDRKKFEELLPLYDSVETLASKYSRGVFHRRDRELVDRSFWCIACLTKKNSGTGYTVSYAHKNGVTVLNAALEEERPRPL